MLLTSSPTISLLPLARLQIGQNREQARHQRDQETVTPFTVAFAHDVAFEEARKNPPDVVIEGAEIAEPEWDTYRSDRKDLSVYNLTLVAKDGEALTKTEIQQGFSEGLIYSGAQNFARSLVNEPGNVLTPTELGKRAARRDA